MLEALERMNLKQSLQASATKVLAKTKRLGLTDVIVEE